MADDEGWVKVGNYLTENLDDAILMFSLNDFLNLYETKSETVGKASILYVRKRQPIKRLTPYIKLEEKNEGTIGDI